jgi:hypothetical protein
MVDCSTPHCIKPAHSICSGCNNTAFCASCIPSQWPQHFCLIEGKRGRKAEVNDVKPSKGKKKAHVEQDSTLMETMFHVAQNTTQLLENMANAMSIEQLREMRTMGGPFRKVLWTKSQFWYYVLRRHRPDLVGDTYILGTQYKQMAMRRLIAPDITATLRDPNLNTGLPPMMREVMRAVMRNPAAINVLLTDLSLTDILSWSQVSREFYQIVIKSNFFWFLMIQRYATAGPTVYNQNMNYEELARSELLHLFRPVLRIEIDVSLQATVGELRFVSDFEFNHVDISPMTIITKFGNLQSFFDHVDFNYVLVDRDDQTDILEHEDIYDCEIDWSDDGGNNWTQLDVATIMGDLDVDALWDDMCRPNNRAVKVIEMVFHATKKTVYKLDVNYTYPGAEITPVDPRLAQKSVTTDGHTFELKYELNWRTNDITPDWFEERLTVPDTFISATQNGRIELVDEHEWNTLVAIKYGNRMLKSYNIWGLQIDMERISRELYELELDGHLTSRNNGATLTMRVERR